jgi:hypothetical protein
MIAPRIFVLRGRPPDLVGGIDRNIALDGPGNGPLQGAPATRRTQRSAPLLSSFEQLGLALIHAERPSAHFMVMTAYLDESGTHGNESELAREI